MIKRSMTIHGHRTSISLEQPFWDCLAEMAEARQISLAGLVAEIDTSRTETLMKGSATGGLSSVIRVYILNWALSGRLKKTDLSR
ncbi:MAG: ribbon-helix-helix domain-containing protein [Alphaproteobacteria bacterium]|nr:ribbon-helix-helix domain-containing protein [Alphaproteobacteria bacterium]